MKLDTGLPIEKTWCEEVIICTSMRRGKGEQNDPVRIITQVFLKDGTLIAEYDPYLTEAIFIKYQ